MDKSLHLPFYAKASLIIIGLVALFFVLYIAQAIILPIIFSIIIAIVLHPGVSFLVRLRFNRVLAITIVLLLGIVTIMSIGTFLFAQLSRFGESLPLLVERFNYFFENTITWTSNYFDLTPQSIHEWILNNRDEMMDKGSQTIGNTIVSVGNGLVVVFLIPVYVFMILVYQPLIIEFLKRLFGEGNRLEVSVIINQIKILIQSYLTGLMIEVVIIATLYTIGLSILGIEYALVLAIIGALLNVIPYLGAIIAAIMPMMIALVTKSSLWGVLLVLAMYVFIQFIDNNYLVPKIVASKVKINALVSIVVVIGFGALWGIPGMFISIPITAIAKLIFDHINPLKPWGFLLGDTMPGDNGIGHRLIKKNLIS